MVNTVIDGEMYLDATAAARFLGVSRPTFYKEYINALTAFRIGKCRRRRYRQSELEMLQQVEPIERVA